MKCSSHLALIAGSDRAGPVPRWGTRPPALRLASDPDEADVPAVRPRGHGSAGPDEEPGPRPDDEPAPVVHPPAAGPPVHARGEPAPGADRPLCRRRAADRGRDGPAPDPGVTDSGASRDRGPAAA